MRLSIYTYNGHAINDGSNYQAFFPEGSVMLQQPSEAVELIRPNNTPIYSGQIIPEGHTIPIVIKMLGVISTQVDQLKAWLNTHDETQHKLIVKDTANSDKQWYIYAKPIRMVDLEGQSVTFILSTPDPIWREETESSDTWNITASGDTHAIVVGGNINTRPTFVITPTSAGTSGYVYKRFVTAYNRTTNLLPNYPLEITGVIDSAALVSGGKVQADGDDLRVLLDGAEVNRWIDGINTTQTKVWITTSFQPKLEMTLLTALGTAAETTIALKVTSANKAAIGKVGDTGLVQIDSELFTYSAKDNAALTFTIEGRAERGSSTAAHNVGATVRWIEHDIWLVYGNASVTAPETDDTYKPIINLNTSTNTSWDYDQFTDNAGLRAGSWRPVIASTTNTRDTDNATEFYTANQTTNADPAVEMGMAIRAWRSGTTWKADTGKVYWQLYHPCGVWKITSLSGEKYRATSSWPSNVRLYSSNDGVNWTAEWATEATPTTAATWTAWTKTNEAFSADKKYLRYTFGGTVAGSANNAAYIEISDITLALSTGSTPSVTLGAEAQAAHVFDAKLTNSTTGEWMKVNWNFKLNESLTMNCDDKTVTASTGENAISAVSFSSVRRNWLDLRSGTNALLFELPNTGNVTLKTYWRDRNS